MPLVSPEGRFSLCVLLLLIWLAVPHVPLGVDVLSGGERIDVEVVTAEGFEHIQAFRDARAVQELIERALDLLNVMGAVP